MLTFLYTSGTTGNPKGCLLSHRNYVAMTDAVVAMNDLFRDDDTALLFLPLAHNFARLIQFTAAAVGFPLALCPDVRGVSAALAAVRPTLFPSVPRVYEKVHTAVKTAAAESGGVKSRLAEWAFAVGERTARGDSGAVLALQHRIADRLVLSKVRARMGGRMRFAVSGGAPLAPEIARFFDACGVMILEGYGMTECTTAATFNPPGAPRFGTVGPALPGIELKLDTDGEILIRGATVFGGYYRNPEATAETLTPDGWLRSGDIGTIDADGYLTITDRKKDIIVTAGGKNVAPQVIENVLTDVAVCLQRCRHRRQPPVHRRADHRRRRRGEGARRSRLAGGAGGDRARRRRGERRARPRRADQALHDPGARLLDGGGRDHGDAEGQAAGRDRPFRGRDRKSLRRTEDVRQSREGRSPYCAA